MTNGLQAISGSGNAVLSKRTEFHDDIESVNHLY